MPSPSDAEREEDASPTGEVDIDELEDLFIKALEAPAERRPAFIEEACRGNQALKLRLIELLAADSTVDSLLDHSLAPPAAPARVGERIGDYTLQSVIGRGGMGVVYAAEQTKPIKRQVAVKVIAPGFDTSEFLSRFETERQLLSLMDHPNIAKVLDAGTTDQGLPYFVMELIHGAPITDFCMQQGLSAEARLELFVSVCKAIQHAHQKGIIHRDIKPSNVLVTTYDERPVAKVIDFGVAKAVKQPVSQAIKTTQFGQIIGTVGYMSPEQSSGSQLDIDTRSDVYSLGALLYELLTGCPPVERERLASAGWEEILRAIREDDPPKPSLRLRERRGTAGEATTPIHRLPGELDWVVMKAIEKDRTRRYPSPNDLAGDVESFLKGEAVSACPPTAWYRLSKLALQNKAAVAASVFVATSLLIGLAGTSWQAIRASRAEVAAAASAAESRAANDFLIHDLLGVAGAESQLAAGLRPDPNLKLVTLLERAAEKLDARFEDQGELKTELKAMLAKSFDSIGRYEEAARLYGEVFDQLEQTPDHDQADRVAFSRSLVRVKLELEQLSDAELLCQQTLERSRSELGAEHPTTLLLLEDLADIFHKRGALQDAERTYLECLNLKQHRFGESHTETLATMSRLADVTESLGRREEAESKHQEVLDSYRAALPDNHPAIAASLHRLGRCRLRRGRDTGEMKHFSEAIPPLRDGFQAFAQVRGADHPNTLEAQGDLAQAYSENRRHKDAEQLLSDLVDRLRRLRGSGHATTVQALNHLGCVYLAQSRWTEAELTLAEAQENLPVADRDAGLALQIQGNLAIAYHRMGKLEESADLDEEICRLSEDASSAPSVIALAARVRLGLTLLELSREADGRTQLEVAYRQGPELPARHVIAGKLADSYASEDPEVAVTWTNRQIDQAQKHITAEGRELASVLADCGLRLIALGKATEADSVLGQALSLLEQQGPRGNARGADTRLLAAIDRVIALLKKTGSSEAVRPWEDARAQLLSAD